MKLVVLKIWIMGLQGSRVAGSEWMSLAIQRKELKR
jgi:hypothetical protein